MTQTADEVVEHKVKQAAAKHALRKLSGIVDEERSIDMRKDRYARWFLRYGVLILVAVCAVLARYSGVF